MDIRTISKLKMAADKRCNVLTCIHYAGGFCTGCEKEDECEFSEKTSVQD